MEHDRHSEDEAMRTGGALRQRVPLFLTSALRACFGSFCLAVGLITFESALAGDDKSEIAERILLNRLNNLESQAVQRRGREPTTIDLLRKQDDRLAGQALNMLKTKDVRNRNIPLLRGKLDRSRRPASRFNR